MPKSATAALSFSDPGPPYRRTSRYATNIIHSSSDDVSRASHCHQTPQALRRPQRSGHEHDGAEEDDELGRRGGDAIGVAGAANRIDARSRCR